MGIDAKETTAILWKIVVSSMNTSIRFMRNHPIFSGVSMFLLTLYIFLPSMLFFLIYSSPVLACAVVYVREKLGLRFSNSHKPLPSPGCGKEKNGVKCHLRQQRSVRRNARMKVEEWDSQKGEEEKDKVILTSLYNDLLGRTPQFEESPKAIETEQDNEKYFDEDVGNLNDEKPKICNCEINEEKYGKLDGKEESENGISEIERNRRLESLIARRRARRLFKLALDQRNKLQAEETISPRQNNNNNNLQITVPKNMVEKHWNYPSDNTVTRLKMPGSAPSVLLQGRNPFDIPYDPQEERPNLTGDSFDEEFSLFNQNDMFFCRHESFCRFALFSSEPSHCMNSPASASDISTARKRLDLHNEYMDDQIDQKLHCDGKEADRSIESVKSEEKHVEMNGDTYSNKEEGDDSSCSEESESELNRLNKAELREAICHSMDNYPGFLVNQVRNSIPSPLPKAALVPRLDDNDMFYSRKCANSHSRTFSVASDMQVEVSEIGSPPTTVDWLDEWSSGGENYMYDTDLDREIIRGEESQKRLSHQFEPSSGTGSKEEINRLVTKPLAKTDRNVVEENRRAVNDTPLLDREIQTKEDIKQVAEEIFEQRRSSSSDVLERSNSGKFDGLMFHTSVSLSSITEEPETILDSESMKYLTEEGTGQRSLTSLDSSVKKFVADANQLRNPKRIDLDIINHQQWNNVQAEHGTEINMEKYENTKPGEYEETQSSLDADTSYIKSVEREIEEEPILGNFTEDKTKQIENEALQTDLKSSLGQVITELQESKLMEDNGLKLVENFDEKVEPLEQETTQIVSLTHPHTEDNLNVENPESVIFMQVQESNSSTDQEISQETQIPGLMKDLCVELTQECNNRTNVEEEPVVSENVQNSQPWTQQCDINFSERISPRTLEIAEQPKHEDVIVPNTASQDFSKNESAAAAEGITGTENNDGKLTDQVGEAMEKRLELNVEAMG